MSWRGDNLFEIACNTTPMMNSKKEMERLSKRYGVTIEEPICQPGVKIPDRTGAAPRLHTRNSGTARAAECPSLFRTGGRFGAPDRMKMGTPM